MLYFTKDRLVNFQWFDEVKPLIDAWNMIRMDRYDQLWRFWNRCEKLEAELESLRQHPHLDIPLFEDMVRE